MGELHGIEDARSALTKETTPTLNMNEHLMTVQEVPEHLRLRLHPVAVCRRVKSGRISADLIGTEWTETRDVRAVSTVQFYSAKSGGAGGIRTPEPD